MNQFVHWKSIEKKAYISREGERYYFIYHDGTWKYNEGGSYWITRIEGLVECEGFKTYDTWEEVMADHFVDFL